MRTRIYKTFHKTKIDYSIVELKTGKTSNDTMLLDTWLNNFTRINNILTERVKHKFRNEVKIYSINSIEHVSIKASISDAQFLSIATIDENSIVVIKKLK